MTHATKPNLISIRPARMVFCIMGLLLWAAPHAQACSVCFGDPNSDLAKGAVRGVAFMIVVTTVMLLSIASIAGVWIVRARRLANGAVDPADHPDYPTEG